MAIGRNNWLKVAFSFKLSVLSLFAGAQCSIQAPDYTCIDDVISLSVNSSKTISSASWNFGDLNTSNVVAPSHRYSSAGKFTIKVQATFGDGTTCDTSREIIVYAPPDINFNIDPSKSVFCLTNNKICVLDKTNSGQSTTKYSRRILLWDDGGKTEKQNPGSNETICYTYQQSGKFDIALEATNDKGCKATKTLPIEILFDFPGIFTSWLKDKDCEGQENYFQADTTDVKWLDYANLVERAIYEWGDGTRDTMRKVDGRLMSHRFDKSGTYKTNLILQFKNGCETRYERNTVINLDKVEINHTKFDSVLCYPNYFEFSHPNISGVEYSWTALDTAMDAVQTFGGARNAFFFPPYPAKYYIRIRLKRGSCITTKLDSIESIGVRAETRLLNGTQCEPDDTVYFCDASITHRTGPLTYFWHFNDKRAEQCTTDTKNGINLRNCNFSKDRHSKHKYDSSFCDQIWFYVRDSVNGCRDSVKSYALIQKPVKEDYRASFEKPCLLSTIDFGKSECIAKESIRINYDSLCDPNAFEEWEPTATYNKTCDTSGWVTYGVAIKNGSPRVYRSCDTNDYYIDSSRICRDTFWFHKAFHLNPAPRPQIGVTFVGCLPSTLKGFFHTKYQPDVDYIYWNWGDGNYDTTILHPDSLNLPTFEYTYRRSGDYEGFITLVTDSGCSESSVFRREIGFFNTFRWVKPVCPGGTVQFHDSIVYWDDTTEFWRQVAPFVPPPQRPERVYWDFGDGDFSVQGPLPKHVFDTAGVYTVRMRAVDKTMCADTTVMQVQVDDLKAGIKTITKKLLCEDIIQLIDSSTLTDPVYDKIVKHYWDFGDGKSPSFLEDPYHFYSTYGEFTITHAVVNKIGCTDTTYTKILIEGPQPHFDILSDTVACAPHLVEFKNNSVLASDYIWYFGDTSSNSNTYSTQSDTNVTHLYKKPGVYYIYLFAGDSVTNPDNNNQTYYCNSIFPDTNASFVAKRRVVILPIPEVDFDVDGTFCTDQMITLTDKSDTIYDLFRWYWQGDSAISQQPSVTILLKDTGSLTIDYRPTYIPVGPYQKECYDSISKDIEVFSNNNSFNFVKDSLCPTFYFSADVGPGDDFMWEFGHPSSGPNNVSFIENPTHSFAPDNGTFEVCLISTTTDGCVDTICQMVESIHEFKLFVPNVMTPNNDQLNDFFEIEIDGEDLYELSVYSRWGEKVYEADRDYESGSLFNWDGNNMNNGKPCPSGTYFYIFKFREGCVDDAEIEKMQGTITLIRDSDK